MHELFTLPVSSYRDIQELRNFAFRAASERQSKSSSRIMSSHLSSDLGDLQRLDIVWTIATTASNYLPKRDWFARVSAFFKCFLLGALHMSERFRRSKGND